MCTLGLIDIVLAGFDLWRAKGALKDANGDFEKALQELRRQDDMVDHHEPDYL